MRPRTTCSRAGLTLAALVAISGVARAQGTGAAVVPSAPFGVNPQFYANPYANSYMNPYINPLMTQQPMSGRNSLLYLYSAQQANAANGGILPDRPRGNRGSVAKAAKTPAAEMPRSAQFPGGGASRFFGRTTLNGDDRGASHYQRHNRYFGNNGR